MEAMFVLLSKILVLMGFSLSDNLNNYDIVCALGVFISLMGLILILYVAFVAVRQFIHNFKVKRSYEYKVEEMLYDLAKKHMKNN